MTSPVALRCMHAPFFQFVLAGPAATLGRSSKCDIVLNETSVSRLHANIRVHESELLVIDLGSRNGTFVDGVRVRAGAVGRGGVLRFGNVSFAAVSVGPENEEVASDDETNSPASFAGGPRLPLPAPEDVLSVAQQRVFEELLAGNPEKIVARHLDLSYHTVHNHVRAIYRIFGVGSRAELLTADFRPSGTMRRRE